MYDINRSCDPFQWIQTVPWIFRVSFGSNNVVFNDRVILDMMYINYAPIIHVVGYYTNFSAALFLPNASTTIIWSLFM